MSWLDNLQSDLIITTGDGKQYMPLWFPSTKSVEFNIAEFEFPEVAGTLVKRGSPKGRRYNFEIFFQGENFLEDSNAFEQSTIDNRAWIISHPYYSNIIVHPVALTFDNTLYNTAKITGTVIETITEDRPKTSLDPKDQIISDKEVIDAKSVVAFDVTPSSTEVTQMQKNNALFYNLGNKVIKGASESEEYFNLFNKANTAILSATALPLIAIRAMQAVINYPALTSESVKTRIGLLGSQFNTLRDSLKTIFSRKQKKVYENNGASLISAMVYAISSSNDKDFPNKGSVLDIIEMILAWYHQFLNDLDSLQSINGGDPESYIPDADLMIALNDLINFAISNLFKIALNSKQERTVILEDDTNLIILAHRFYGLKADDSTIDELIENNNIGLNEILGINKGRVIVYYI